jgi:hypothetical protein
MAVVNDQYKYIFLAEAHTASQAIAKALIDQHQSRRAGRHHAPVAELMDKRYIQPHWRQNYNAFCVVRNPADLLVTEWLLGQKYRTTFARYVRRTLRTRPRPDRYFFQHAHTADTVIKYEQLPGCLNQLMFQMGAPVVTLSVIGKTPDKESWERYYTSDDLVFVLENYPEVAKFGYADIFKRNIREKLRMEELTS